MVVLTREDLGGERRILGWRASRIPIHCGGEYLWTTTEARKQKNLTCFVNGDMPNTSTVTTRARFDAFSPITYVSTPCIISREPFG